ncbi:fimbria/pilus outer membrane usher protein [Pseudomonas sp. D47]|uniref:fimbria/pilus outer membrane usher protein n=1 Tax=Pseudomonas sp. D47 TaxID=3159447 RepID=UPI00387ADAFE
MALHEDGLTFSPYPLRDTFAVAQVGNVAGVKLSTPSGPVWTDTWGRAVIRQLNAYRPSQIEVATQTLPRNVDLKNGVKALNAGRGSAHKMDFSVITTRRVLLRARDPEGNILPKGAGIFSGDEQFLTTVVDNGKIFLSNEQLSDRLLARLESGKHCRLDYTLPDKADPNVYFESADANCTTL